MKTTTNYAERVFQYKLKLGLHATCVVAAVWIALEFGPLRFSSAWVPWLIGAVAALFGVVVPNGCAAFAVWLILFCLPPMLFLYFAMFTGAFASH